MSIASSVCHVLFQRAVILVVDPLPGDGRNRPMGTSPSSTIPLAILFLARSTSSSVRSVFTRSSSCRAIFRALSVAFRIGRQRQIEAAAAVVWIKAEIGIVGDGVVDQRPIEAAALGVADHVGQHAGGEAPVVLRTGAGRQRHRVLPVELRIDH